MATLLRLLILEDSSADSKLILRELEKAEFDVDFRRAETEDEFTSGLGWTPDVVLADVNLPGFGTERALEVLRAHDTETPFIVVSGSVREDAVVRLMRLGVTDFLLKDRLARLPQAIRTALEHVTARKRHAESEERYHQIFSFSPIGIGLASADREWLEVNRALCAVAGCNDDGLPSRFVEGIARTESDVARIRAYFDSLAADLPAEPIEFQSGASWLHLSASKVSSTPHPQFVVHVMDITERIILDQARERALAQADERSDRDPLTGLLNHRAFHRVMAEKTSTSRRAASTDAVVVIDLDNFRFFNDAYGHAVGDRVLRQFAERLAAGVPEGMAARFGGDEFAVLLGNVGKASARDVEARVRASLKGLSYRPDKHETAIPITFSAGVAFFPDDGKQRSEVMRVADERLMRAKSGESTETEAVVLRTRMGNSLSGFSMLDALVTSVDNKDRYTRHHSEDVMTYSVMIARGLGLDEVIQQTVAIAALLHDVGKIGVPDAILRKPARLTDAEFEAVKQHPQMGAIIVGAVPGLEETLDAVRHHHERWDGEGYPFGLRGEETPLIARLMAVADAFSAMTTDRPYRKGMSHDTAASILVDGSGTQWDPTCVTAFLRAL